MPGRLERETHEEPVLADALNRPVGRTEWRQPREARVSLRGSPAPRVHRWAAAHW